MNISFIEDNVWVDIVSLIIVPHIVAVHKKIKRCYTIYVLILLYVIYMMTYYTCTVLVYTQHQ